MTSKEKAFELAHKFRLIDIRTSESTTMMISMTDAKQCALIAVDEIIASNPKIIIKWAFTGIKEFDSISYWNEVKKEIEKL
jgi:hypothetical protein